MRKYPTSSSYSLRFRKVDIIAFSRRKKIETSEGGCHKRQEVTTNKTTVMTFREATEHLLYVFSESLLNGQEFALLYHLNTSKKPGLSSPEIRFV